MSVTTSDIQWEESYHRVNQMLQILTKNELDILSAVAVEFLENKSIPRKVHSIPKVENCKDFLDNQKKCTESFNFDAFIASVDE